MSDFSKKMLLLAVTLALIGGAALALNRLHASRKLGVPGIIATPTADSIRMNIELPEFVPGFISTNVPEQKIVTDTLPKDTSFAQRRYTAADGFFVNGNIILMGADRTSIHKPEYCLPGQGWQIVKKEIVNLPIGGTPQYELPVAKWFLKITFKDQDGKTVQASGIYVFWFVADGEETPDYRKRMWWMARDLLTTGVLQRWAYISYFSVCYPGQEEAAFQRMEKLITASVPQFQRPPVTAGQPAK
jgi:hypothetical protein